MSELELTNIDGKISQLEKAKSKKARTVTDDNVDQARELVKKKWWFKLFVLISTLFAAGEAILIGWSPKNFTPYVGFEFKFQLYVLIVATGLFWIGVLITALAMYEIPEEDLKEPLENFLDNIIQVFDAEVAIEFFWLLFGWITIFYAPGISTMRTFRTFRYFWYFELFSSTKGSYVYRMIVKSSQLVIESLEKIGEELFTTSSKGGIVLLAMFFYLSYLFAVVFHTSMGDLNTPEGVTCGILSNCFIVMLRLVFYDGTGLDFMNTLVLQGYRGWAFLIILYMCFSAMILLNGLVGIFGIAFQGGTEDDEDEEEEIDEYGDEVNEKKENEIKYKPVDNTEAGLLSNIKYTIKTLRNDIKGIKRHIDDMRPILQQQPSGN